VPGALAAVLLVGLVGCRGVVSPMPNTDRARMVVLDFCRRFGGQSGLGILSLLADSVQFEMDGLGVRFSGRPEVKVLTDYAVAVRSRLRATDISVNSDTVFCRLAETNDWLGLLNVKQASYDARFTIAGARITGAHVRLAPESEAELGGRLAGFMVWVSAVRPDALGRLFPGGRPAYRSDVVPELIALLKEWRARSR
jgi:hypothetical protein